MRMHLGCAMLLMSLCRGLQISPTTDRRSFLGGAATLAGGTVGWLTQTPRWQRANAVPSPILVPPLPERFDSDTLKQPPAMTAAGDLARPGIDNTYFPDFLDGTWQVTQTLVDAKTPLGLMYIGGPNGDQSIAEKSLAETRSKLNQSVNLHLRFVPTRWGVAEDRVFNNAQRLNAFAGRKVVATVDYADVGASNRAAVLKNGGTADDPLQTVLVKYKGPAAQKVR